MAGLMEIDEQVLAAKFEALLPHPDERGRRLVLGAEARWLGHGGLELVTRRWESHARQSRPEPAD